MCIATCPCERSAAIRFRVCVATAALLLAIVSTATAKYSGGSGTAADPYQIVTAADLIALGETPADYGRHFIMTVDIDLDPNLPGRRVFDKAVIAPDADPNDKYSWFVGAYFTGVFDGNNHTISHLTVKGGSYLGLFGLLKAGGEIRDLGAVNVNITGSSGNVGGLVGWNDGAVIRCYSTGAVSAGFQVGGLVGTNGYGTAANCYSTGAVSGGGAVGGLVGWNKHGVSQCYSTGVVNGTGRSVGGLVGSNDGPMTQCYSTGVVSSTGQYVGGLVGRNGATVTECYSTGAISGTGSDVGGLVGSNRHTVTRCYSTGAVSGKDRVGGLVGDNDYYGGRVTDCFWDTQTSNQAKSAAGTGKTTAQMRDIRTYLESGWDFVGETENGTSQIWQVPPEGGYPALAIFSGYTPPRLRGQGTPEDPYVISNLMELGAMVHYSPSAHYRLAASIDLSGIRWRIAVVPQFAGTFDGNGHTISHLTINGGSYLGLFGQLASGAEVKNLGVVDVNITGSGDFVGALAWFNEGTVTQCYSTGAVSGSNDVGGLVGSNFGSVTNCYSTGAVSGKSHVDGLVGSSFGSVTNCYSTGAVSGKSYVGGLAGVNEDDGTVTQCFWDAQTSGQTTSAGGTGKTTAQMQTAKTYLDAGWDLVGEVQNGTSEIWQMPQGSGYPILTIFHGYTPPQLKGLGTLDDPYLISNAMELGAVVHYSASAHYRLAASIDLSGIRWGMAVIPSFAGTFDGNGHTICHLTIKGYNDLGLFGYLEPGAQVKSLGVVDVNITGSGGGLGGLAAWNGGTVAQCYSTGSVTGAWHVGGLVGYNDGGTVTQCYSTGRVSGQGAVGGLVGYNGGTVAQCYSTGAVSGKEVVGGLVGGNGGTVTQCYSTGRVSGQDAVGGLVGGNGGTVTQCYSTGTVSGKDYVGGLVGRNDGAVTDCYAAGTVTATGFHAVGGLVGGGSANNVTACFWDTRTSGQTASAGGTGKTTIEMQRAKTFLDAGWDFVGETKNGTEDIWWVLEGKDYPRLWWEAQN